MLLQQNCWSGSSGRNRNQCSSRAIRQQNGTFTPQIYLPKTNRKICGSAAVAAAAGASEQATSTVLYVTQLDTFIKGDELTAHFRAQPGFESAFVMDVDDDAGQQQHLGFVQFSSAGAAAAAQEALDGSELKQTRIRVSTQRGGASSSSSSSGEGKKAAKKEEKQESAPASSSSSNPSSDGGASDAGSSNSSSSQASTSSSATADVGKDENSALAADQEEKQQEQGAEVGGSKISRSKAYRLRQNQKVPPTSASTLFVHNLRSGTTQEQLQDHFKDQPGLESVTVQLYKGRRYDGYVQFSSAEAAAAAKQALGATRLNNKPLDVYLHDGEDRPRARALAKAAATAAAGSDKAATTTTTTTDSTTTSSSSTSTSSSTSKGGKGNASVTGRRQRTFDLKVANLAWATTAEGLTEHFKDCEGFIESVTITGDDGRATGFGYVRFSTVAAAQAALQAMNETELDGRNINITVPLTQASRFAAATGGKAAAAASSPAVTTNSRKSTGSSSGSSAGSSGGVAAWALQVFNLAWDVTDQDLADHFSSCQGFQSAFIITGKDNRPSGSGFVLLDSEEALTAALKTKQGTELVGRSVYLRTTKPGRVESSAAGTSREGAAAAAPQGGSDLQTDSLVLTGLPSSFTYREVLGLCSFFGEVQRVSRFKAGFGRKGKNGSAGSDAAGSDAAESDAAEDSSQDSKAAAADRAREGQPSFVKMSSPEAAQAAVAALDGHVIQGCKVSAGFSRRSTSSKAVAKPTTAAAPE